MNRKVLLTGRPGCGKTTLVRRVVKKLAQSAGGFYMEEIRKHRERVGFKIVTLDAEKGATRGGCALLKNSCNENAIEL